MKNIIKALVAFSFVVSAQAAIAGKVVVLDLQAAILMTDLAKHRQQELAGNTEYAGLLSEAESLRAELQGLDKKAQSEGLTWSQEQIAEHQKKGEFIQGDLQRVFQKIQTTQKSVVQGIVGAVKEEFISEALTNIVKAEGIDLVLRKEVSNYAAPSADITVKLAEELNKKLPSVKK